MVNNDIYIETAAYVRLFAYAARDAADAYGLALYDRRLTYIAFFLQTEAAIASRRRLSHPGIATSSNGPLVSLAWVWTSRD